MRCASFSRTLNKMHCFVIILDAENEFCPNLVLCIRQFCSAVFSDRLPDFFVIVHLFYRFVDVDRGGIYAEHQLDLVTPETMQDRLGTFDRIRVDDASCAMFEEKREQRLEL